MSEVKVRRLTKKDRTKLSNLIEQLVEKTDNKALINMVPSSSNADDSEQSETSASEQTADVLQFAFNLMEGFLKFIEEDVTEWFMDLIGETDKENYNDLDFDIEVQIIDQIISQKSFENFFLKGSQVVNKIKGFVSPSKS